MSVDIDAVSKGDRLEVWTCPYTGNPPVFVRKICDPPSGWPPVGYMLEEALCVGVYDDYDHLLVEATGPDCHGFAIRGLDSDVNVYEYRGGPKIDFATFPSGKNGTWVKATSISRIIASTRIAPNVKGGAICDRCGDVNLYAAANQPDGTFVCYLCRQDPYRVRRK